MVGLSTFHSAFVLCFCSRACLVVSARLTFAMRLEPRPRTLAEKGASSQQSPSTSYKALHGIREDMTDLAEVEAAHSQGSGTMGKDPSRGGARLNGQ